MNHILGSEICPVGDIDSVTWMWKSNNDPFDSKQLEKWTAYPWAISRSIEKAYRSRVSRICISRNYTIDLNEMLQVDIDDTRWQRPVKRCAPSDLDNNSIGWRRERFAFKLDQPVLDDVTTNTGPDDVKYYGSRFIVDWLLTFTGGKLKVKFHVIFPVLVHGIQIEGQLSGAPETTIKWLIDKLEEVKVDVSKKKESERIECLAKRCVKLYTKDCFLFHLVNVTLRDDDRTKLNTLGPYCYLVFNHTGQRSYGNLSVRHHLYQQFRSTQGPSLFVYRGDSAPQEKLDEYQKAAGHREKLFRWLSFVSTSHERHVAKIFARNILYVVELERAMSNDQFTDLRDNTFMPDEKEVLLRPGVRFRVESSSFDSRTKLQVVHIKIVPSYVSSLR